MRDTIKALIELQQVDDQIRGQQVQRDELSANLDRLKTILERMGGELAEKREKLAEAERFYSDKQHDLDSDAERISHAKHKLNAVTRTKEYAAMQRELDALRKKYDEDQQELKRLAGAMDEYQESIAAQEEKLRDLQAEVEREEAASADRLNELDGQIDEIAANKKGIEERLKPSLVRRYKRVLKGREGRAVVPAFDGKCSGCQMRLPPQLFIQVQRGETLETCPACQRFIYFDDSGSEPNGDAEQEQAAAQ
ncbi:MAG: zinc ribbon domain-containing protein [Myxococcota bacterium]